MLFAEFYNFSRRFRIRDVKPRNLIVRAPPGVDSGKGTGYKQTIMIVGCQICCVSACCCCGERRSGDNAIVE